MAPPHLRDLSPPPSGAMLSPAVAGGGGAAAPEEALMRERVAFRRPEAQGLPAPMSPAPASPCPHSPHDVAAEAERQRQQRRRQVQDAVALEIEAVRQGAGGASDAGAGAPVSLPPVTPIGSPAAVEVVNDVAVDGAVAALLDADRATPAATASPFHSLRVSPSRLRGAAAAVPTPRSVIMAAPAMSGDAAALRREVAVLNDRLHAAERDSHKVEHALKVKVAVKEDLCRKLQEEVQGHLTREADREATMIRVENDARRVKERLAAAEERCGLGEAKCAALQRAAGRAEDAHQLAALQMKRQEVELHKHRQLNAKLEQLLAASREKVGELAVEVEHKDAALTSALQEVAAWEERHTALKKAIDEKQLDDAVRVKDLQARNDALRHDLDGVKADFADVIHERADADAAAAARLERAEYNETVLTERLATAQKTIDCVEAQLVATQAKLEVALQDAALKQATLEEHFNGRPALSPVRAIPARAESPHLPPSSRGASPVEPLAGSPSVISKAGAVMDAPYVPPQGGAASVEDVDAEVPGQDAARLERKVKALQQRLEQLVVEEGAAQAECHSLRAEAARLRREAEEQEAAARAAAAQLELARADGARARDDAAAAAARAHEDATRTRRQLEDRHSLVEGEKRRLLEELAATQAQCAYLQDIRDGETSQVDALRATYEEQIAATRALAEEAEANATASLRELQAAREAAGQGDEAVLNLQAQVEALTAECLVSNASQTETREALERSQEALAEAARDLQRAAAEAARWKELQAAAAAAKEEVLEREVRAEALNCARDAELASLKKQAADSKRAQRAAQDELAAAHREFDACTAGFEERLDALRGDSSAQLAEARRANQRLEARNQHLDAQAARLTEQLAAAEDGAAHLQLEADRARADAARGAADQAAALRQQLSDLRQALAAKEDELEGSYDKLAAARAGAEAYERQKVDTAAHRARVGALEAQVDALRREADASAEAEQGLEVARRRHADELAGWQRREALLQAQLDSQTAEAAEKQRACAAMEADKRRAVQAKADAANELRGVQRAAELAAQRAASELSDARAQLAAAERDLVERRAEVTGLKAQLADAASARREAEARRAESPRLHQEVAHLQEDVANARAAAGRKDQQIASLTSDFEALRGEMARTRGAEDALRRDGAEARDKLQILAEQKSADKLTIARLEGVVAELENSKAALEAQGAGSEAVFLVNTRSQLVAQLMELRDALKVAREEAGKVTRDGNYKKAASAANIGLVAPKLDRTLVEYIQNTCKRIAASKKSMEELLGKYLTGAEKLAHGVQAGYTAGPQQDSMVEVSDDGLDDVRSSSRSTFSHASPAARTGMGSGTKFGSWSKQRQGKR